MNTSSTIKENIQVIVVIFIVLLVVPSQLLQAQDSTLGTDELYTKARKTAFEDDDYPEAIRLIKLALKKSPDYLEMHVFLGRLYTYTDSLDKARYVFKALLEKEPGHEEGSFAYGNLEYWNDDSKTALKIVDAGLSKHSKSEDLLLLKAKLEKDLKDYKAAEITVDTLLEINPKSTEARSLSQRIKLLSAKNSLGVSYDFVYFDKRFNDPWHLTTVDYGRATAVGSVIAKLNYANRFQTNGVQFEVDAYPSLLKKFYMYLNLGISDSSGIFPKYRGGLSLYANLPASFEVDAGFRYLYFSDDTWIYTFSIGKYYKSYWFNIRTYLTPSITSISQSYTLTIRYYFGGADDFFSFNIGTGLSPDDASNSVLFNPENTYRLKSSDIGIGYRKAIKKTNVIFAQAALENQEYARDTRGNQISIGVGYIKKF